VLPFRLEPGSLTEDGRARFEEKVRAVLDRALRSHGFSAISGERTRSALAADGVEPTTVCEERCSLRVESAPAGAAVWIEGDAIFKRNGSVARMPATRRSRWSWTQGSTS
jgi:hypothetical protein